MEKPAFGRVIRNNLLILLAAVLLGLATKFVDELAVFLFGFFYLAQALVNLILALTQIGRSPTEVGPAP